MSSYNREEEAEMHLEHVAYYGKIAMVSARERKIRACEKDYAGQGTIGLSNLTGNAPGSGFVRNVTERKRVRYEGIPARASRPFFTIVG